MAFYTSIGIRFIEYEKNMSEQSIQFPFSLIEYLAGSLVSAF